MTVVGEPSRDQHDRVVVLVDPILGAVVPAAAVPALRAGAAVYASTDVPGELAGALGARPVPDVRELSRRLAVEAVVLLAVDPEDPAVAVLRDAGATVLPAPAPPGARLLAAVAVMDRLRSPGGCPWDAAQTHASLRRYLVEETFELLDAIDDVDRPALREELGDVLLQVLFHARIAAEDSDDPFTVDEVAAALVGKLVGRHPHVFAGGDAAVRDAASQERRWEELKRAEKGRTSCVDGVALSQPALSLAAKLTQRATRAGVPAGLLPAGSSVGERLFTLAAAAAQEGHDPEGELRSVARGFAARVRAAERAAQRAGIDPNDLDADAWREFWSHPS